MFAHCPACKAKYSGKPECYRCGLDLAKLAGILHQADIHLLQARLAYLENNYSKMYFHARRALSLHRSQGAIQLMACAALLNQKFDKAIVLWQEFADEQC